MATVGTLIDRAFRDWLTPVGEQPARFKLSSTVSTATAGATSEFPINVGMLAPEEQEIIRPGTMVEVGSELVLIEEVGDASFDGRRGMFDTEPVEHIAGSLVTVGATTSRKAVFDAIADTIDGLWPELWTVRSVERFMSEGPVELPYDVEEIVEVRYQYGSRWEPLRGWDGLIPYAPFTTGRAIQFPLGWTGRALIHYRARPERPVAETEELSTLGVHESWGKMLVVAAVAQLIGGPDVDAATHEFVTETLEREGFPAGAGGDLREGLLRYVNYLKGPLRRGVETSNRFGTYVRREI